jgi:UDP-galactopyranose mutase
VQARVDGQFVPMPINLNTINKLYGLNLNSGEMEQFLADKAEKLTQIKRQKMLYE